MSNAGFLASYFTGEIDAAQLPPYLTLGARRPPVGAVSMDSSDQSVINLDDVTGVAACRSGINLVGPNREVSRRFIGEILFVLAHPTAPVANQLRSKLTLEQSIRFATGRRPFYSSLRQPPPMISPRLVAAGVRNVEDHRTLKSFANSIYAVPGMLFMADGRLDAQNFPGAAAVDLVARLLRARGVRYVALTKSGLLLTAVSAEAKAIRKRVGSASFAFPVLPRHLDLAYRHSGQTTSSPKTIRHGSSSAALGGVGAVRFALSLSGNHLCIVEMSLYDFSAFAGLVRTGVALEAHVWRLNGSYRSAIYSPDILPFVKAIDWERHIVPTLEEIVYYANTDTELGIYPRGLSDIHSHVKLRFSDPQLESYRKQIIVDLARAGIPVESIHINAEGPHKTDPDEYDKYRP